MSLRCPAACRTAGRSGVESRTDGLVVVAVWGLIWVVLGVMPIRAARL
jgi:hypothetical protein